MNASMKPCVGCYKDIDSRARKCPNCLSVQPRVRDRVVQVVVGLVFVAIVAIVVGLGFAVAELGKQPHLNDTSVDVRRVEARETRIVVGQLQGHDNLYVVGKIKNNSSQPLGYASLEVRCFDEHGTMIDSWLGHWNGRVAPGAEVAFKVDSSGTHPKDRIGTHSVTVTHVRVAN